MKESKKIIEFKNISKSFGDKTVLDDVSLYINRGEFVTILGPSGCGKTTLLRILAGFGTADSGQVLINGVDITDVPPHKRPVNTVFQRYALFPHLDVYDNIAFGLKLKKVPEDEIDKRVRKVLKMVSMNDYEDRDVESLSGGQQQRVAIARAIVGQPTVLLLDEPLAALDLKMRKDMQIELKEMHKKLGITFVYVTHDQEEALTLSDTIVVMNEGKIQQIGTPTDIYNEPQNSFVADFIGESNIIEASVTKMDGNLIELTAENGVVHAHGTGFVQDEMIYISVRPENTKCSATSVENFRLRGIVSEHIYIGSIVKTVVTLPNGQRIRINQHPHAELPEVGSVANIYWDIDKAVIMHTAEDTLYDTIESALLNRPDLAVQGLHAQSEN